MEDYSWSNVVGNMCLFDVARLLLGIVEGSHWSQAKVRRFVTLYFCIFSLFDVFRSSNIPNICIYEYNMDVASKPALCSNYISMMMNNYNLVENSVPIAPQYEDPSVPRSKQRFQSIQLYVATDAQEVMCNYTQ